MKNKVSQTIQNIFNTSELALAVYANLANNSQTILSSNIDALYGACDDLGNSAPDSNDARRRIAA